MSVSHPEVVDVPVDLVAVTSEEMLQVCFRRVRLHVHSRRSLLMSAVLIDTFMTALDESLLSSSVSPVETGLLTQALVPDTELSLALNRDALATAQENDPSLDAHFASVANPREPSGAICFYVRDGILMRKWSSDPSSLHSVTQLVVLQVLSLTHDLGMAGHLGIRKTYHRVLRNFFWPGLKSDVVSYCRSCHTCQLVGKPNQTIPRAPLHPIPAIGDPLERVILNCVGLLPKTKTSHQYVLTVMCAATRFPEAFPLNTLKAKTVLRALTTFFSIFGLPAVV